ncbi:MAG: YfhO family protein, partial [Chloroflexota bacterium]
MKLTLADVICWLIVLTLYTTAWFGLRRWRDDIRYVGIIGLVTVGFFWRVLFVGAFIPEGGGDMAAILYPVYHFAQENLRQGIIPLWNPHLYAGIPFVGHIQSGPFYPPNLLLFFLTPEVTYRSLEYLLIAHFWLAGVMMYAMLRNLTPAPTLPRSTGEGARPSPIPRTLRDGGRVGDGGLSRLAALLGAIVFMFNDFNITHIGNPNMVAVGAWLPLVMLLFMRALAKRRAFLAALAGAVTGMAYLAGHIQPFLYILFTVGLYAIYFMLTETKSKSQILTPCRGRTGHNVKSQPSNHPTIQPPITRLLIYPFTSLALYLIFTVSIAAISFVPNLELSSQALRESLTYTDTARFSLPPAEMVGLFVPALFGRGPGIHWGPWERVEVGYVGILPLILAALGLMWRKERTPRFFVLLGLVALALAMGLYSVVHGWLFLIPGYAQIRVPARFVFLLDFAIAALAAYGFDALLHPLPRAWHAAWRKVFPTLSVVLAGVVLVFMPLMFVAVTLNQSQDVSIFNRTANGFNGLATFALWLGGSLALLLARRAHWLGRKTWALAVVALVFLDLASLGAYLDSGEKDPSLNFNHPAAFEFLRSDLTPFRIETPEDSWFEWQPNLGLIARLDDAAGIYNPLLLQRYDRYWKEAMGRESVLYDLLNTKYLVAKKGAKVSGKFTPVFDGDPAVTIYRNTKALPRAFMVYQAQAVANGDEAFAALTTSGLDPMKTIVIEENSNSSPRADVARGIIPNPNRQPSTFNVQVTTRSTNSLDLAVTTDADGWLFVGETFYPGWRATVDGNDAPVLRADYLFRAVRVSAGTHTIKMVFDPWSWKVGVGLTGLGVIGWLG